MSKIEKFLFGNNLNKFRVVPLQQMKFMLPISIICLSIIFAMRFASDGGIVVKHRITSYKNAEVISNDSIYEKAVGNLQVPNANFLFKFFFYKENVQITNYMDITTIDFVAIIGIIFLLHFFIRSILTFGPFSRNTIQFLKCCAILSFVMYPLKMIQGLYVSYRIDKLFDDKYRVDTSAYSGYGWIYCMAVFAFIINIFNYGRKLQEENDLTV